MRSFFAEGMFETEDGEKLQLVCDFYAVDVVEQITELNWDLDIIPQMASPSKALGARLLYGLLRKRQPNVTLDEAMGLTYDKNAPALWAVVGDVIRRACNLDTGEAEEAPAKKKSGGRSPVLEKSG